MAELDRMIVETRRWRALHRAAFIAGSKGRCIDAAACAIREIALLDARRAVMADLEVHR